MCVALAPCAMALQGQVFVGRWPNIRGTIVLIILGKPHWRWHHIEYSPQSLAPCVCALLCWHACMRNYCVAYCSCTVRNGSAGTCLCWVMAKQAGTHVFIVLGEPQWQWRHTEYSPQSLALCVCALPSWPVLTAQQLLYNVFVLLLHLVQWLCRDKPLLGGGQAIRKHMSS